MRIATGGILHETNTFARRPTELPEFLTDGAFPGLKEGDEVLTALRGTGACVGGYLHEADRADVEIVPLIWAFAQPSGTVRHSAYVHLRRLLLERLARVLPLDGLLLDLHGAMVTDECEDVEGDLLRHVRTIVGPGVPVVANLDYHANITPGMAAACDALIGYDTYPHVDCFDRGVEAARLIIASATGKARPTMALTQVPLLIGLPAQRTTTGAMQEIMSYAHDVEKRAGVLTVTVSAGFPFADIRDAGASVAVVTDADPALAARLSLEIADFMWQQRRRLVVDLTPLPEAIAFALKSQRGPVVLGDGADNPGGGAPADGTVMLRELVHANVPSAVVAVIADPEAVELAGRAGDGRQATLRVGGKTDNLHGETLTLTGKVRWLGQRSYVNKGLMLTGMRVEMGRVAVLVVNGVEVVLAERRLQPFDAEALRSIGIEPRDKLLVGLKSAVHFRADYERFAARIFDVDTPGIVTPDFTKFDFRRLRRPVYPLEDIDTWRA